MREALIERERLLHDRSAHHPADEIRAAARRGTAAALADPRSDCSSTIISAAASGCRRPVACVSTRGEYGALQPGFAHGFAYSDCWVDDSRLVVLNAIDAAERGASIRTRTRFVGARERNGLLAGALRRRAHWRATRRARARHRQRRGSVGRERAAHRASRHVARRRCGWSRAVTSCVPRLFDGEHAFMLQNPDGRIVFAIPYERDYTLVGTTDVPFEGDPAPVRISADEIDYLCDTINRYFRRQRLAAGRALELCGRAPVVRRRVCERLEGDARLPARARAVRRAARAIVGVRRQDHDVSAPRRNGARANCNHRSAAARAPGLIARHCPAATFRAPTSRRFCKACGSAGRFCPSELAKRLARAYGTRLDADSGRRARHGRSRRALRRRTHAGRGRLSRAQEWALTRR